ncbi:MAG: hypothetical protein JW973_02585 [Bacteroidales bacterium]|nr:hypothetical protein [Bacteroidales bacterium]
MNQKTLKRHTAIASFGFAFFCLLWILLSWLLLPIAEGRNDYSLMIMDPEWFLVSLMGLLSSVFGIFAVFGIYHTIYESGGPLLLIGIVLLVLGIFCEFATLTWDTFIWPVVCANDQYISFVRSWIFIVSPQFKAYIAIMLVSLFTGSILTAVALVRSRRFGKPVPWMLMLGILLYGAGHFSLMFLTMVGLCIYSLAFTIIGIRLLKE